MGSGGGVGQVLRLWLWAFSLLLVTGDFGIAGGDWMVVVDSRASIAVTDDNFVCATLDWWPPEKCDYGTCSWGLASLLNLDLSNPTLLSAVKAFSPLKLRLGGTLQDKVIYDEACTSFVKNSSELFGFSKGCLPMSRWDELNDFFKKSGALVYFGLNALNGRERHPDGSQGGPWNFSNAASLIQYTVNKGYSIHGWELGNELCGNGVGAKVDADQYAADVINLKSVINSIYQDLETKPLVIAPGGFFDRNWFAEFVRMITPNSLDVITHHIYNLGPGVDNHLIDKILDPRYLDGEKSTFSNLQAVIKRGGTTATAWVGEAGGAYNSGHHLVSDSFVYSFWYLDQLGMSATYDTKTYCRQTLVGGNYGLLNTTTFTPNPDYYSALLWHRLMGKVVLSANFIGPKELRAYAHCAKQSEGITLLLINLDGNTTFKVFVSTQTNYQKALRHQVSIHRTRVSHITGLGKEAAFTREEYHLTAKDGDLQSQTMLLNGKILSLDSNGDIPALEPIPVDASESITVDPFSIVFAHMPYFHAPACR